MDNKNFDSGFSTPATIEAAEKPQTYKNVLDFEKWTTGKLVDNVRVNLAAIQDLQIDSPMFRELQRYGKTIDSSIKFINSPHGLPGWQAQQYLEDIAKREETNAGVYNVIKRLRNETAYFSALEPNGSASYLHNSFLEGNPPQGVHVRATPEARKFDFLYRGEKASFTFGGINLYMPLPSAKDLWSQLVTKGKLPAEISYIYHETIHEQEDSSVPTGSDMLTEIHALDAESELPLNGDKSGLSIETQNPKVGKMEISVYALDKYVKIDYKDVEKLGYTLMDYSKAYDLIHTLRVFGKSDAEIAKLVLTGQSNYGKGEAGNMVFIPFEEVIASLRKEWGLEKDEDFKVVANALFAKAELERLVQIKKAQDIACQELQIEATGRGWVRQ